MQSPRKKLWLWFTTFVLIMACVPAVATPAPIAPLDPNAISTFILQTAAARLRKLLSAALGSYDERALIQATGSTKTNLEDWLRDDFFKTLDTIFPGPGGAAPEAYAW